MKKTLISGFCLLCTVAASAQYASTTFVPVQPTDRSVFFSTVAEGEYLPILWGLDTAWPDEANMRRGVRFIGAENIGVARVSFQPWDYMLSSTTLTSRLMGNLNERLRLVSYIGGPDKVKLILNNDAPAEYYDKRYSNPSSNADALTAYCNLIYGTTLACQEKGWTVLTASPLNEPDYQWNGQGTKADFLAIARRLKTDYPQYKDGTIRISGGNTLNCDEALPWYQYLYDYIDEGNTHQLAGDFNHYANFFSQVRNDGKYATADELHNVMEAMVGVEYGMQTGIWWGTAELARGEFCRASFGRRLAYVENRDAWTSAAVYRAPDGKVQAFVGSSERQATPCTYRLVSTDRDVYFNGHGPQREYLVEMPGGYGYQQGQTNAECVVDITWGEDVSPVIDGKYMIVNKYSQKVMSIKGAPANLSDVKQYSTSQGSAYVWEVKPTPITIGGDFSYYTITLGANTAFKFDVIDWSLEDNARIILYDGGLGGNEQWYLRYAGDGYFRIFSRHSNLCLQIASESTADGIQVVQATPSDSPRQLWRFVPSNVMCETVCPDAPTALKAVPQSASIRLEWSRSKSTDVASYTVLRAPAGTDDYNTVGRGFNYAFFVDNTVEPGIKYDYKIKCVDRAGNSSPFTEAVTAVAVAPSKDLVARWLFDGSLADATDNHFDALTTASTTLNYVSGHRAGAKAVKVEARKYLQLPYRTADYDALTISTWINWQGRGSNQCIFDLGVDAEHHVGLWLSSIGAMQLMMQDGDTPKSSDGGMLPPNEWHHVAVSISPWRVAVFLDGTLVSESSGISPRSLGAVNCYIGRVLSARERWLDAAIEDFRVYNYAVSDDNMPKLLDYDITGISDITVARTLISTEYFTTAGVAVEEPTSGIYIVRRTHSDGSVSTLKERR